MQLWKGNRKAKNFCFGGRKGIPAGPRIMFVGGLGMLMKTTVTGTRVKVPT